MCVCERVHVCLTVIMEKEVINSKRNEGRYESMQKRRRRMEVM